MPSLCADGSKERVPPRTHRQCNDRYFAAGWVKYKNKTLVCALLRSCLTSPPFSLFLMQAEKRKTGKNWLSTIIMCGGHVISAVFLSVFPMTCLFVRLCGCDLLCRLNESPPPSLCCSLSSNSTKLFSEETGTIAMPQRPVFNHWTLCVNITVIYWMKPYEVWRSTFSFLNKSFPLRGIVEQNTHDSTDCSGFRQIQA